MLDVLKFVQGAVARKDFVPELTHYHIEDGIIKGYNGRIALHSPIDLDLTASPKALPFVKAIEACKGPVAMSMTPAGRLAIKSGKFKAFVDCSPAPLPEVGPKGDTVELNGGLLKALKTMSTFIAEDASRPWATGILFRGQSAFATNNIILAEQWLGYPFPVEINIPAPTVKELLRIKLEPESLQITEDSVTFHFEGDKWMRSQVYTLDWPDLQAILNKPSNPTKVPDGFFEALESIAPFVDDMDRVFFVEGGITTHMEDGMGAFVEVEGLPAKGCYQVKQLRHLEGMIDRIDFTTYPKPAMFFGDNFRGAIIGMRT